MKQLSDENIAKKKDKTISKHYTILVNGNKQKILNYKIRPALKNNDVKIKVSLLGNKYFDYFFKKLSK